jgi:hypothetical protein
MNDNHEFALAGHPNNHEALFASSVVGVRTVMESGSPNI